MQKVFYKAARLFSLSLVVVMTMTVLNSCGSDDSDEPGVTPAPGSYSGSFVTTIPTMPSFTPIEVINDVTVTWLNAEQTLATVKMGEFTISTGMPGRDYHIGEIEITDVACTKSTDGSILMKKEAFTCMAGSYETTGSFDGLLADGKLTFTVVYKPGSMPFDVQSVFTSK